MTLSADPWLEIVGDFIMYCISGGSEKMKSQQKKARESVQGFLVFVRDGVIYSVPFFFFRFFSFFPFSVRRIQACCVHPYYPMAGVVNSEAKLSTAAEAPVEAGNAAVNQNNDRPTVHVFNEQTNYVPKRTIITVCTHVQYTMAV